MKALVQRVASASVKVAGETVGEIGKGFLVLVGVEHGDGPAEAGALAHKLFGLRTFEDAAGKMNLDLQAVGGEVLVVSQFTLSARLAKGRRPSFNDAAAPDVARPLVDQVIQDLRQRGLRVAEGRFGAHMDVALINDGPVTYWIEVKDGRVQ